MRTLLLLALALALGACDNATQYACTDEFRTIAVEVVNASGRPVSGLTAQSVLERNGQPLADASDALPDEDGLYAVASDADLDALSIDGERVVFTATGDRIIAQATYVIADDGCHVTREDGPTEITARAL